MNIPLIMQALECLNEAVTLTIDPKERQELVMAGMELRRTLRKRGVFIGATHLLETPAWVHREGAGKEGSRLDWVALDGNEAASVFLGRDLTGHNWFVWDKNGAGGENSCAETVNEAKGQAEAAARKWGEHKL